MLGIRELKLIERITSGVGVPFYSNNDKGHQYPHAVSVMLLALSMWESWDLRNKVNVTDLITAALLHDVGIKYGREYHHFESRRMLECSDLNLWFTELVNEFSLNRDQILCAVEEHRASYKGVFSYPLCELISSADRGTPDFYEIAKRVSVCSINRDGTGGITHVIEKYGRDGYARWPELYRKHFKVELEHMWDLIDDHELLVELFAGIRPWPQDVSVLNN